MGTFCGCCLNCIESTDTEAKLAGFLASDVDKFCSTGTWNINSTYSRIDDDHDDHDDHDESTRAPSSLLHKQPLIDSPQHTDLRFMAFPSPTFYTHDGTFDGPNELVEEKASQTNSTQTEQSAATGTSTGTTTGNSETTPTIKSLAINDKKDGEQLDEMGDIDVFEDDEEMVYQDHYDPISVQLMNMNVNAMFRHRSNSVEKISILRNTQMMLDIPDKLDLNPDLDDEDDDEMTPKVQKKSVPWCFRNDSKMLLKRSPWFEKYLRVF